MSAGSVVFGPPRVRHGIRANAGDRLALMFIKGPGSAVVPDGYRFYGVHSIPVGIHQCLMGLTCPSYSDPLDKEYFDFSLHGGSGTGRAHTAIVFRISLQKGQHAGSNLRRCAPETVSGYNFRFGYLSP